MTGGQRGRADDVHVILDRLLGGFVRGLEQRADIHVEAEIGERGGDHLLAPVVAVLAHLGDQDPRTTAFQLLELADQFLGGIDHVALPHLAGVNAGDRLDLRHMTAPDPLQRH